MKLKTTILIVLIVFKIGTIQAQLGIGTSSPAASSILDLSNTNKGLLIPRMSSSATIISPAKGLMYFNTTNNRVEMNEGTASVIDWKPVIGGTMGDRGITGIKGDTGPNGFNASSPLNDNLDGSTIVGGYNNSACGKYATVVGGLNNTACGENSVIGGGSENSTPALSSTIAGGKNNLASGINAFIGGGEFNVAAGLNATITGGSFNTANGINATIGGGDSNTVSVLSENGVINGGAHNNVTASKATISGGDYNIANGVGSTVSGGSHNTAASYGEWVGGTYSTEYPPNYIFSPTTFNPTDRIFNVGNGTSHENRKDAFTILKNGLATLPSVTNTLIAEGSVKSVVTKEYAIATYSKIKTIAPASSSDFGVAGEVRITQNYIYSCISANQWVRTPVAAW
jgi:hypothetical protein